LKDSKNPEVKKAAENLINQWKEVMHKSKKNNQSYLLEGENVSRRNNTRKNLLKYLEKSIKDKNDEIAKKNLIDKVVEIEDKLFEKYSGETSYLNRVLEIIYNLKDEKNEEFRDNIVNGTIKPEDLCTMDAVEMLSKNKKEEIEKEIEKKVDEVRSDWQEKHGQVTEGVYKCSNCGGRKTIQHEQQTRSADEPMTLFITCLNCKKTWKG